MKSFGILRTNVGLTSNIKITVDSNYKLSLDSIESHPKLSDTKYKNVKFIKSNYFDELIPYFFNGLPNDIAYSIKYNEDVDKMTSDFSNQYDEIYSYGARNINNNKNYTEEFEYFAPLHISLNDLPKKFIIFRVDGAGFENSINLDRNNFKKEIIKNLKTVKLFDLTKSSALGEWIDINFTNNNFFPKTPLEVDFRPLEFCRWNGIDYKSGGYVSKSLFLDEYFSDEKEIFEFEKFMFDKWRENGVIYPNILNMSFLFDDTPSTPDVENKWSINRYFGFYLDEMVQTQTISPYITPFLKSDVVVLQGNILYSPTGGETGDPFLNGYEISKTYWTERGGNYYKIETFTQSLPPKQTSITTGSITTEVMYSGIQTGFRIISDEDLTGKQSELNKNFGYIDESGYFRNYNNEALVINNYSEADVWIIEIDGIYHNITEETIGRTQSFYKINSDFSFGYSVNEFTYKVAGKTTKVSTIVDSENAPKKWNIWKLNFTDIKDFDTRFVDTEYSKYEYEYENELTETDESKMYMVNLNSTSNPEPLDDFIWKGKVKNIPVSSEYTANHETFKIENNDISSIWRKNPVYCRWAFQNSISGNDVPYILNNSETFEDWNRTVNTIDPDPKRIERNLDYFYTINSSTASYLHHSLHIEKNDENGNIDTNYRFELDKYLNLATYSTGNESATYSFDYFTHFFEAKNHFLNGNVAKNIRKFSIFNSGDQYTPNVTLFRGLKFYAYNVDSIQKFNNNDINSINLKNINSFDGWKFSIILSDNDYSVNNSGELVDSNNGMEWEIISEWQMDKKYVQNEIVLYDDILYTLTIPEIITSRPAIINPTTYRYVKTEPSNQFGWVYVTNPNSIFWSPTKSYTSFSSNIYDYVVWNNNTYWKYNTGTVDFWNPIIANTPGYNTDDIVLYKSQYYKSMTGSNSFAPDYITDFNFEPGSENWTTYWQLTSTTQSRWSEIPIWNPSLSYLSSDTIVHNLIVWVSSTSVLPGSEPGVSNVWVRQYSIEPDTDLIYTPSNNPIIRMNNRYYLSTSNTTSSTLDNGIIIYINKKWKNILININIADNTIPQISEIDRDLMYTDLNKKLSAYNFITCINDIKGKYGFTDYVSYVVIEENGKISKYNYVNEIEKLPILLTCEGPENISIKSKSLIKRPIQKPKEIKAQKELINGTINSMDEINYYNSSFVSVEIIENKSKPLEFENYHGNKNILATSIYRFSGWYMPLFYTIQLFEKGNQFSSVGNWIFDEDLTEFGLMKERIISKANRRGSKLRLKDSTSFNSIYPMIDEIGYSTVDFFIFLSTWQYGYHSECDLNPITQFTVSDSISLSTESIPIPGKYPIAIIDTAGIGLPRSFQNTNTNGLL